MTDMSNKLAELQNEIDQRREEIRQYQAQHRRAQSELRELRDRYHLVERTLAILVDVLEEKL
jgi:peptidoglycan hydrolase CwlO-like protein